MILAHNSLTRPAVQEVMGWPALFVLLGIIPEPTVLVT